MGNGSRYCLGGLRGNPAVDYARIRRHCKGNNRTIESRKRKTPTHIFLQTGVGSFAASITSFFLEIYYKNPPIIVLVEPNQADCYYTSFLNENSERTTISGELDSIMSGLC